MNPELLTLNTINRLFGISAQNEQEAREHMLRTMVAAAEQNQAASLCTELLFVSDSHGQVLAPNPKDPTATQSNLTFNAELQALGSAELSVDKIRVFWQSFKDVALAPTTEDNTLLQRSIRKVMYRYIATRYYEAEGTRTKQLEMPNSALLQEAITAVIQEHNANHADDSWSEADFSAAFATLPTDNQTLTSKLDDENLPIRSHTNPKHEQIFSELSRYLSTYRLLDVAAASKEIGMSADEFIMLNLGNNPRISGAVDASTQIDAILNSLDEDLSAIKEVIKAEGLTGQTFDEIFTKARTPSDITEGYNPVLDPLKFLDTTGTNLDTVTIITLDEFVEDIKKAGIPEDRIIVNEAAKKYTANIFYSEFPVFLSALSPDQKQRLQAHPLLWQLAAHTTFLILGQKFDVPAAMPRRSKTHEIGHALELAAVAKLKVQNPNLETSLSFGLPMDNAEMCAFLIEQRNLDVTFQKRFGNLFMPGIRYPISAINEIETVRAAFAFAPKQIESYSAQTVLAVKQAYADSFTKITQKYLNATPPRGQWTIHPFRPLNYNFPYTEGALMAYLYNSALDYFPNDQAKRDMIYGQMVSMAHMGMGITDMCRELYQLIQDALGREFPDSKIARLLDPAQDTRAMWHQVYLDFIKANRSQT